MAPTPNPDGAQREDAEPVTTTPRPAVHLVTAEPSPPTPEHEQQAAAPVPPAIAPVTLERRGAAKLGEVLVEHGVINEADLRVALEVQRDEAQTGHWVLLGEVLQRLGFTSTEEINACVSDLAWHNEPAHFDWSYHPSVTSPLKRAMDIAGALVGLGITVSILPGVSLAVFLEDGGPVFFKQYRVGLHGWQFPIFKFRTMVPDADRFKLSVKSDNALFFSTKHDRRVTRVGRVLRKTMIDELPQFWNVLSGQMSLVGTRPPTLDEVSHYTREHFRRLEVKPGLTGLWQASGGRHEKSFEDVLALDLEYQRTWSLLLDVKIIAKTVYLAMLKAGKS